MPLSNRLMAEFLGTFVLVLGGCGAAVLAAAVPELGIGYAGVALAFGLTLVAGIYALGHISGGHFNPAVTVGLWLGQRFGGRDVLPYIIVQVIGGIAAGGVLLAIASGKSGFAIDNTQAGAFATNGYGDFSPQGYNLTSAIIIEIVLTFVFVFVILGATDRRAPVGFAGVSIGLTLTLIHLVAIPVTNTSVNPARSTGVAVWVGGTPLAQIWLFWLAPLVAAVIAGVIYKFVTGSTGVEPLREEAQPGVQR